MASFQETKEEIQRRADLVGLVGKFVKLKKSGRNYTGLCPFHSEKSPSFNVSPERQFFHCFGCKKGGNVFDFWMEYHGVSFQEAFRELARIYGVDLPERPFSEADRKKRDLRAKLLSVEEAASAYFSSNLRNGLEGSVARAYLEGRGLDPATMAEFRLGYAVNRWDGLLSHLQDKGIDPGLAEQAGLLISKANGYYDRFRGRVIFPIFDLTGQVVGFGGRCMDDSLPKYLNSPETLLFHKGELLYGLHEAVSAVRETGRVIIVEGYMDCLALRSHGIREVVAVLGTALTPGHVRRLKGFAAEAYVVFDSDEAGRAAAVKSLPLFLNEGMSARAIALPEGEDPDSFVKALGRTKFLELVSEAPALFDFILDLKSKRISGLPEEKALLLNEIAFMLKSVSDETISALYVRRIAQRLDIPETLIWRRLREHTPGALGEDKFGPGDSLEWMRSADDYGSDLQILNLMVHHPGSFLQLKGCNWGLMTSAPVTVELIEAFFRSYETDGSVVPEGLGEYLITDEARRRLREILLHPSIYTEEGLEQAVSEFRERHRQTELKELIRQAKEKGDISELNALLKLKGRSNKK
ncbi:MAG: DNA primase [Deltaproteobacteria bacterium CG17_big_fil_post_rev_8_21_14_2_50_51_6]|nr:MAG: DNA primase [Deltaproteobacteria bacterium CG17_big_fil_post_rev_8_21_14_2_50_51_6]